MYRQSVAGLFQDRQSTGSIPDIFNFFKVDRHWSVASTVIRVYQRCIGGLPATIPDLTISQPLIGKPGVIGEDRDRDWECVRAPLVPQANLIYSGCHDV